MDEDLRKDDLRLAAANAFDTENEIINDVKEEQTETSKDNVIEKKLTEDEQKANNLNVDENNKQIDIEEYENNDTEQKPEPELNDKENEVNDVIPLPLSVKKVLEEKWGKIDPELKRELAGRINTDDSVIKSFKEEKRIREETLKGVKPYLKYISSIDGISIDEANRNIIDLVARINDNPDSLSGLIGREINPTDKVGFVRNIANNLGVDLNALTGETDPEYEILKEHYLKSEAQKIKEERNKRFYDDYGVDEIENMRTVTEFSMKYPEFTDTTLSDPINLNKFQKFVEIAKMDETLNNMEVLEKAKSFMDRTPDQTQIEQKSINTEQNKIEREKQKIEKAKKKIVSLKSVNGLNVSDNSKTLRGIIEDAFYENT